MRKQGNLRLRYIEGRHRARVEMDPQLPKGRCQVKESRLLKLKQRNLLLPDALLPEEIVDDIFAITWSVPHY